MKRVPFKALGASLASIVIVAMLAIDWSQQGESSRTDVNDDSGTEEALPPAGVPSGEYEQATRKSVPAQNAPDWDAVLNGLRKKKSRSQTLEEVLEDPGLIAWLLERLEEDDILRDDAKPVSFLLRGVLSVWDRLPYDPVIPRREFVRRTIVAGNLREIPGLTVSFAWRGQRFLSSAQEGLVESVRPTDMSTLSNETVYGAGQGALLSGVSGITNPWQARLYLILLEDVLKAYLEGEDPEPVRRRLDDPEGCVRLLALRLLRDSGFLSDLDSQIHVLATLSSTERQSFGLWAASEWNPTDAAELLVLLQQFFMEEDNYLAAWLTLGNRSTAAVAASLQDGVLVGPMPGSMDEAILGDGSLETHLSMFRANTLARGHSNMLSALAVQEAKMSGPEFQSVYLNVFDSEWNPMARVGAWECLANSPHLANREMAIQILANNRGGILQALGPWKEELLVSGIRSLAASGDAGQRAELRELIPILEFEGSVRNDLLALLEEGDPTGN